MSITRNVPVHMILMTALAVALVGCAGGGNGSSSAPPILGGTTQTTANATYINSAASIIEFPAAGTSETVTFSHYGHMTGTNLACTSCHTGDTTTAWAAASASAAAGRNLATARKVPITMNDIYAGKYCGKCHNGLQAYDAKSNCSRCHKNKSSNGPELVIQVTGGGEVPFSHKAHVESYGKTCADCHTNSKPWPMAYATGLHTMAQMSAGDSCGKCHAGTVGLDVRNYATCTKCHTNTKSHEDVNTTLVGKEVCQSCHAAIVADITTANTSTHGRHGFDWVAYRGAASGACSECHHHEGVLGKQGAVTAGASNHTIACQTCHDPAVNTPKRLRKDGYTLCGTCHHARYVYGTEDGSLAWPNYYSAPADDPTGKKYFLPPAYLKSKLGTAPKAWNADADTAEVYAAFDATTMGHYPHYSGQWDGLMGPNSAAWFIFTADMNGAALTTRNSGLYASTNACVDCHMAKNYTGTTNVTGHTFVASNALTAKKYAWTEDDVETNVEAFKAAEALLLSCLDVDGDGVNEWFARTRHDYEKAVLEVTAGRLTKAEFLVLTACAWNYDMMHADKSEGMHNYNFLLDVCNNSYKIAKQVLTGKAGLPATWVVK